MKVVNVDDVLKILHKYGKYIFITDEKRYSSMVDEIANLKALEQQPCEDCISRAKAIEEADKLCLETAYDNEKVIEMLNDLPSVGKDINVTTNEDCISRQAVLDGLASIAKVKARSDAQKSLMGRIMFFVEQLPPVTPKEKTGHCKDCKWWKDNDGVYRRGIGAESKCPINRKEVYEGNGYCFLFEPQESEDNE